MFLSCFSRQELQSGIYWLRGSKKYWTLKTSLQSHSKHWYRSLEKWLARCKHQVQETNQGYNSSSKPRTWSQSKALVLSSYKVWKRSPLKTKTTWQLKISRPRLVVSNKRSMVSIPNLVLFQMIFWQSSITQNLLCQRWLKSHKVLSRLFMK